MKHTILGWIAVVWGLLILVSVGRTLLAGQVPGGVYATGVVISAALGVFLLYAGIDALRKRQ
jgi:hypothetical protein